MHSIDQPERNEWFIVYVGGMGERRVADALERRGWTVYLPMAGKWVPVRRRGGLRADRGMSRKKRREQPQMKRISVPLYPRYLFVACETWFTSWRTLKDCPGVASVVMKNREVAVRLPGEVIDWIRERAATADVEAAAAPKLLKLPAGTRVRVTAGPFASFSGVVVDGGAPGEVTVDVEIFGRAAPVTMPLDHVEIVG